MNPSMPKMSLTITAIIPFALGACSAAKQEPFVPATMLKASLDATQHAQVLHTTTEIDSGPDTAMRDEWHNWAAEGRGYRSELPGLIEVYNEPQRKHYRFEKDTHQIG
ncbi:MAG TPA: hypothetical protein VMV81_12710, partial [Phycisphaerae bacterium]|nr:hypothetical protein [Phycisphaerae bacterium]